MSEPKPPKMGFEHQQEHQARLGELLWDAHSAGGKIVEFTVGKSAADFAQSEILQAVVAKMLEILAASLTEVQQLAPEQGSRIAHLDALAEVHTQPGDDEKVWLFVQQSLPALLEDVSSQLEDWHQG